jgi:PilZ domain
MLMMRPRIGEILPTVLQKDLAAQQGDQSSDMIPRRFGRLRQETLACNLGTVLDLSLGGMRVSCRKVPNGLMHTIDIDDHPLPEPLRGRIIWKRRTGWFKHEIGIEFEALTPEQSKALADVSRDFSVRRLY